MSSIDDDDTFGEEMHFDVPVSLIKFQNHSVLKPVEIFKTARLEQRRNTEEKDFSKALKREIKIQAMNTTMPASSRNASPKKHQPLPNKKMPIIQNKSTINAQYSFRNTRYFGQSHNRFNTEGALIHPFDASVYRNQITDLSAEATVLKNKLDKLTIEKRKLNNVVVNQRYVIRDLERQLNARSPGCVDVHTPDEDDDLVEDVPKTPGERKRDLNLKTDANGCYYALKVANIAVKEKQIKLIKAEMELSTLKDHFSELEKRNE